MEKVNEINNIKNWKQFLNENKVSSYQDMYKLIILYIKETLKSDKKINEYVPNTHIAEIFKDVLIYLELENMYPNEFHNEHTYIGEIWTKENGTEKTSHIEKSNFHILKWLETDNYFNKILLKNNKEYEIERVYQKLREKTDIIRNMMKIIDISLGDIVMPHKSKNDLNAHKIKIKKYV
jgi:hypothetical protein